MEEIDEQNLIVKANGIIYNRSSLCFHYSLETGLYSETFTNMVLTPNELDQVCKIIEESKLRKMPIIRFRAEEYEPFAATIFI